MRYVLIENRKIRPLIRSRLPNVPIESIDIFRNALVNTSLQNSFYEEEILNLLANSYAWIRCDASTCYSNISTNTLAAINGQVNSIKLWKPSNTISVAEQDSGSSTASATLLNTGLQFNNAQHYNINAIGAALVNTDYSIISNTIRTNSSITGSNFIIGATTTTNNGNLHYGYRNSGQASSDQYGNGVNVNIPASLNVHETLAFKLSTTGTEQYRKIWYNVTSNTQSTNLTKINSSINFRLGRRTTSLGMDSHFTGTVRDIIFYQTGLLDAQCVLLQRFLKNLG